MFNLKTFHVFPKVPEPLSFLNVLSYNLWWSWDWYGVELFRRIDPVLWDEVRGNPLVFATRVSEKRLNELASDKSFLELLREAEERYKKEVITPGSKTQMPYKTEGGIAYFSMEFGIHESLPLFAGGLGILAGDHLKTASELGFPLTGVGLLYRQGYFHQYLNHEGWQQESYPEIDEYYFPMGKARDSSGNAIRVSVNGPNGDIIAQVYKVKVGRIFLYLLDTNLQENSPEVRRITERLYTGEAKLRLAQEILIGIGGFRALKALNIFPRVLHLNEGHSTFGALERLAQTMEMYHVDIKAALEIVPRTTLFTTHTPVAAGYDAFPPELVKPYLIPFQDRLGVSADEILSWGQLGGPGSNEPFSMFILGMKMSQYINGVSKLHGKVARRIWAHMWPERPVDEVPISHITNGIHITTWMTRRKFKLFENYLGPDWYLHPTSSGIINKIDEIYDEELWNTHQTCRARLIGKCRQCMIKQHEQRNAPKAFMQQAQSVLDSDVLTIGFARRFATYKRASLILQDPDRLEAMINSKHHPVQFIFAGKAHPKDNEGKEMIKRIIQFANRDSVRHRFVFLEDYDIHLARYLVGGCDVWLNTPRRPMEACGTSGMKAALNGVLNVSVLDGWWCEGYREDRGWIIGNGEEYEDYQYQDEVESRALYNILENDVIPTYYESGRSRWIKMMKESMKMALREFSSHRMMREYEQRYYIPIAKRYDELMAEGAKEALNLRERHAHLRAFWNKIHVEPPIQGEKKPFKVGEEFKVSVVVYLGEIHPEEVRVELYYGVLRALNIVEQSQTERMIIEENLGNGKYRYGCFITCKVAGRYGFTVRVIPEGDSYLRFDPEFITWAKE